MYMKKTKVYLSDIMNRYADKDYLEIYDLVIDLLDKGDIVAVKSAGSNGRKPALPLAFWQYEEEKDYSEVIDELKYKLHPVLDTAYYRMHPDKYGDDRDKIKLLSDYLKNNSELLNIHENYLPLLL